MFDSPMKSATNSDVGRWYRSSPVPELLDPALVEDRDPVAHDQRLLLVVRHVDDRGAELAADAQDLELERLAQLLVEGAERLVHQQQPRPEHDRPGERDPLLLAARQLARIAIAEASRA